MTLYETITCAVAAGFVLVIAILGLLADGRPRVAYWHFRYKLYETRMQLAGNEPYELWMDAAAYKATRLDEGTSGRKLDKNHYSKSIIQRNTGEQCYLCGKRGGDLVRHEIYQGLGRREKCKRLGIWISVCPRCHEAIHKFPSGEAAKALDVIAQRKTMDFYGLSKEEFIREIGRNYLD